MPVALSVVVAMLAQVVPGWLFLSAHPAGSRLTGSDRMAASVALSVVQLMIVGSVLIRLGLFRPSIIIGANVVITLAVAVVARKALADRDQWRSRLDLLKRREYLLAIAAFVAIVAIFATQAGNGLTALPPGWGYAADADEILNLGGLPTSNVQYGAEIPFAATKTAGFAWLASIQAVSGMNVTEALTYSPYVFLAVALVAGWALLRLFLVPTHAALALLLLFVNYPIAPLVLRKFGRLTVEAAGIALALLAVWAVVAADEHDRPILRWLTAILLVLAALTHGVAALVAVILIACYQIAQLLLRRMTLRQAMVRALIVGIVPLAGVLIGARVLTQADGFAVSGGGYELVDGTGDPTQALAYAIRGDSIFDAPPPETGLHPDAAEYASRYFQRAFATDVEISRLGGDHPLLTASIIAFLLGLAFVTSKRLRPTALMLAGFLVALFLAALTFALRYDLWVFTNHPIRRHFPYVGLAVVVIGIIATVAVAERLSAPPWSSRIVTTVLALALIPTVLSTVAKSEDWSGGNLQANEIAAFEWMADSTPESSVFLANVRTTGSFGVMTQRVSLTEGDTPYTYPTRLIQALSTLDEAQRFFRRPTFEYLNEHGIDYVVAVGSGTLALGGNVYAPVTGTAWLDFQPYLELEAEFGDITIYTVVKDGASRLEDVDALVAARELAAAGSEPGQTAGLLKDFGVAIDDTAAALEATYDTGTASVLRSLLEADYPAADVASLARQRYEFAAGRTTRALDGARATPMEIVEGVQAAFDIPADPMALLVVDLDLDTADVVQAFETVYALSLDQVVGVLLGAGFTVDELRTAAGELDESRCVEMLRSVDAASGSETDDEQAMCAA